MPYRCAKFKGKGVFGWLKVTFVKWCEEEKGEENEAIFRNTYLANY